MGWLEQEQAQRKALGGVNATQEIDQQVNRQIKVLEARLDKALVKFNEALSHNKDLRLEIDHLRKERYVVASVGNSVHAGDGCHHGWARVRPCVAHRLDELVSVRGS